MTRFTILLLIIAAVAVIVLIVIYNSLVYKRNRVRNAFSSIDVNLRKRFDLIPSLVETVKGFAKHEEETFTRLIEARRQIDSGELNETQRLRVEEQIGPRVQRLLAIAEAYPELKSSAHFLNLQRNLTEIEEQISAARRAYNAAVFEINNAVESFPSILIAGAFGFKRHDFFEAADPVRESVDVRL
ncbi:MAG: LemA family protein [Verrucomicrobiales bacterium]|nr:LemA family protein [Verrucomicrobiales bacterium]